VSKEPSVRQTAYTDEVAKRVTTLLANTLETIQNAVQREITGGEGSSQLPIIPTSMVYEWAGTAGENLRKLTLQYFREIGVFPE
jgi:hypothetical protein